MSDLTLPSTYINVEQPHHFDLPRRLSRLGQIAYNLWWSWNPDAVRLFFTIDRDLWEKTYHNPVQFLRQIERSRLNAVVLNRHLLEMYDKVVDAYDDYLRSEKTWFKRTYPKLGERSIAYFSMEYGLTETLALYAGGLGVLSGDHLKEASDLGLPFVAMGFMYTKGYFAQRITEDGWQERRDFRLDIDNSAIIPVYTNDGQRLTFQIPFPGRNITLQVWMLQVGRVPLFLMDSDLEVNNLADRQLTATLYSGNPEMRITQEILLGIGGVRLLRLLGYNPTVWHMNEGHSAFLGLERMREMIGTGLKPEQAIEAVRKTNVFTTHTPEAAGNDEFPVYLVEKYFNDFWPELNMTRDEFVDLAYADRSWGEAFSMPALALRLSEQNNAVSELHGHVSRGMWQFLYPGKRVEDVPITYITNGIHTGTWLARRLRNLYSQYLGPDWLEEIDDPATWENIDKIPDKELWDVRLHLKRKLVLYATERARSAWRKGQMHPVQVIASGVMMDPYALTIGFARRFAPYKRANLVLSDLDRLLALLNRANMPVQIVFAGKSHPDNEPGKLLIQEVYRAVKKAENGGRLVFLEEYDMNLARYLVQGVDVWLNTPRRPREASGTSGEKAALNGVLNFSVLDGWWREGYNGRNGWAIGEDSDSADPDTQDARDAADLYNTLENEIIPLYYSERNGDGVPVEWLARVRESIRTLAPQFSMRRMVKEYMDRLYRPGMEGK